MSALTITHTHAEGTLIDHKDLWVQEPKPHTGVFPELTGTEARALARLRAEGNVRLEQERIPWATALAALKATAASAGESADASNKSSASQGEPTTSAGEPAAPRRAQG